MTSAATDVTLPPIQRVLVSILEEGPTTMTALVERTGLAPSRIIQEVCRLNSRPQYIVLNLTSPPDEAMYRLYLAAPGVRQCEAPHCRNLLNQYNQTPYCDIHRYLDRWMRPRAAGFYAQCTPKTLRRRVLDGRLSLHPDPVTGRLCYDRREIDALYGGDAA